MKTITTSVKARIFSLLILLTLSFVTFAQHTFSIVAVDTITGEVGGAGATCYAVVNDIADVHPGVGFIHTQSYVDYNNQAYAHNLMAAGVLPDAIMDSLQLHDATNQPQLRQYAAVMLSNGPHAAAFTGTSCFTYRGQRVGRNYAIAGNILKGAMVLDSMEARFLRCTGTLQEKLMAALQGAKMVGADRRCLNQGVSSLSAYMIVAQPNDVAPNYYLNLNVENVLPMDPIDSLQNLFNAWNQATKLNQVEDLQATINLFPNPSAGYINILAHQQIDKVEILDVSGNVQKELHPNKSNCSVVLGDLNNELYVAKITFANGVVCIKRFIKNQL
jgi:uncharacterized Ntn-hydrolase superfamily protein